MGDIPAKTNMVSSVITFPEYGTATIESDTTFNISVQMSNIAAGTFTNADASYYAAPQHLEGGVVVGHTHVTVQDMGDSLNPTTPLDPTQFAFFKGINDAGNGKGLLQAVVTDGLPAGNYRVCTIAAAANHQPVLMPVAQRGTADDCTKFTVIGSGKTANAQSNTGAKGVEAAALAASAVAAGPDVAESSASSVATSATVASSSSSTAKATGKSGKGGKGSKGSSTTTSAAKASSSVVLSSGKGNGGGKAVQSESKATTTASASRSVSSKSSGSSRKKPSSGASKKVITVIETFFEFSESLGGLCPSVSKSGSSFNVLEELFDDLQSAAFASCGHQFDACIAISAPGFSVEECTSQKDSCGSAASTATASVTAAKVTATVRFVISLLFTSHYLRSQTNVYPSVPVTVSITGSILSSSIIPASTSSAAGVVAVQTTAAAGVATSTSTPCISTQTITVNPPAVTATPASESECTISTGTVFVTMPASTGV
jgi:hypothetical protein